MIYIINPSCLNIQLDISNGIAYIFLAGDKPRYSLLNSKEQIMNKCPVMTTAAENPVGDNQTKNSR
jgi:hypothetical protein